MIALTRLNGKQFVVNAEHIRYLESTPDTLVTLENGDKFMVKETMEDVVNRIIQYQRQIHAFTP
jgi:flagellar protein FlbD